jgi:hypothetical protein
LKWRKPPNKQNPLRRFVTGLRHRSTNKPINKPINSLIFGSQPQSYHTLRFFFLMLLPMLFDGTRRKLGACATIIVASIIAPAVPI